MPPTAFPVSPRPTPPVAALVLLLFALALAFLPGQASVPPIDRDEPRYTQATKQMVETGDYVRIRFQEAPRHKKPVGIHWLQALAVAASGAGADAPLWVYRLPSLAGAIAAMLLAAWTARAFLPAAPSLIAGALVGATVILGVQARLATTDAMLLASILAAQGALARLWLGRRGWPTVLLFWGALAVAILVKGPIAPMVLALTVLALGIVRGFAFVKRLRPLVGALFAAAIALPWFLAIYAATDGAFFTAAIGKDFLGKAATGQEGHWAPPFTHLALFFVISWPLAPLALAAAADVWRRRDPAILFAAAWVVPSWIVFELVPTKLPHYTLPLVPGIALAAVATLESATVPRVLRVLSGVLMVLVPLGALLAVPALAAALTPGETRLAALLGWPVIAPVLLLAAALGAALAAALAIWRGAAMLSAPVVAPALAAAAISGATVWGLALPALSPVWLSPRIVAAAERVAPCADPRLVSVGYNEPSLVFLAGTETALVGPAEAVAAATGCAVIVSRARDTGAVLEAAETSGRPLRLAARVEGFNISKGDWLTLSLFVPGGID